MTYRTTIWNHLRSLAPVREPRDGIAKSADILQLSSEDREELRRRLAEHHVNPASAIPWEEVRAQLR